MSRPRPTTVVTCCLMIWAAARWSRSAEDLSQAGAPLPPPANKTIDFARDIKPIFAARCYECHGPKEAKGGLQLHRRADAFDGGDNGPVIVSGKATESRLLRYVAHLEEGYEMPPEGDPLSAEQIGLLRAWIGQGAKWPAEADVPVAGSDHWAYRKPQRHEPPAVKASDWPRNAIDNFVLARLEREKLSPSPEADRATLLRRVSLDLIGLPPTIEEVDAFLADTRADAYEQAVERLLASPHYGERWARPWLDLARYADTHGFEKDPTRTMWRYRDWVIDALNGDMPFDQFTIEQIAGDLLPDATLRQKIASGFHRNTMFNTEGGVDPEEARVATIVDRVNTTATVWLGTTLACAQCHSHKYDPFRQKEYYQFFAFFNSVDEPEIDAPTPEQAEKLAAFRTEVGKLEAVLARQTPELDAAQQAWERELSNRSQQWTVLAPASWMSAGGATLTRLGDNSLLASALNPANDTYTVVLHTHIQGITGLRLEVLPDVSLPHASLGRHEDGGFVLSRFEVKAAPRGMPRAAQAVALAAARADYAQKGFGIASVIADKPGSGWAVDAHQDGFRVPRTAYFETKEDVRNESGTTLLVTLRHESKFPEANVGRFRISVTSAPRPVRAPAIPDDVRKILATATAERTDQQRSDLSAYYRTIAPAFDGVRKQLAELRKREPEIPKALVMQERKEPRETHVLVRGNFLSPGRKVLPGVPAVLPPLPAGQPANRLGLARWLVDAENPLTARVAVNRLWQQFFGLGLVATSEDFGTQGEPPSHPELLDYLATELIRQKWSMKAIDRMIVTSATYRQASRVTPELVELDPRNRLLARGPRVRVEAEMVRDIALAASGLLSHKIGGPSVFPPQPEGIWTQNYSSEKWSTSPGEDRHRRGLYTFWRRTSPYPAFMSFDAPSREFCCVRRSRTNTPLQALTTLNDPAFVECARALARRMLNEAPKTTATAARAADNRAAGEASTAEARAAYGFRLCLARQPKPAELQPLVALYQSELEHYRRDTKAALALSAGAPMSAAVAKVDAPASDTESNAGGSEPASDSRPEKAHDNAAADLAAWTVVANVLLNLDATITKE
jgi:mono/diheme cytochrome c family protein